MPVDFEQGLNKELQAVTGLNKKVFPMYAPEGTKASYVTYSKSRTEIIKTLDGNSSTRSAVYDIDIVSDTYSQLQTLFASVKAKLDSFTGRYIGVNSVYVQDVTFENIIELYEQEIKWYRMNLEVRFYFREV
jgi:hypothetical protein